MYSDVVTNSFRSAWWCKSSRTNEFLDLGRADFLGPRTSLALDQHGATRSVTGGYIDTEATPAANSLNLSHAEHPQNGGHRVLELRR